MEYLNLYDFNIILKINRRMDHFGFVISVCVYWDQRRLSDQCAKIEMGLQHILRMCQSVNQTVYKDIPGVYFALTYIK